MAITVTLVLGVMPGAFAFTSNVAANDTVVIGDITYTFVASPSSAFDVDIGADLDESIGNLVAAINLTGTEGTEYAAGTTRNPYVTASADLDNDEIDLTARFGGSWINGLYIAATSPGANDIAVESVVFGLGANSGHTDGSGSFHDWLDSLMDDNQINSEVITAIADSVEGAV